MCGICGVYNAWSGEPVSPQVVDRMLGAIAHRGPDGSGVHLDGSVALATARLSIIDVAGGHQPMSDEAGDVWVAFNGEIWNYKALRHELQAKGHSFRTHSDTESIVHAYEEYGLECVRRLHGMFGFAIWDAGRGRLLLARDRAGKKPLYYARIPGGLVFASEIKSLLCHPAVRRGVDLQSVADFLSIRYVPGPATLFDGISKIMPGQWLLCEGGDIREEWYWDYAFGPTERQPVEEYVRGIRAHVHRAVEERMMADVPVGALLSGGVDSSIVVGEMSEFSSQPVRTFSVGFDVPGFSELPYARLVAERFHTDHHELVVRASDLWRYWPLLTWHRDEPVIEPSDLGVYLISRLARDHVKVVLTGDGGDELFAGYPKYGLDWLARYYHLLPRVVRDRVVTRLIDALPYGMRKWKKAARNLALPAPQRWMAWFGTFPEPLRNELLAEDVLAGIDPDAGRVFRRWLAGHPQRDDLSSMLYLDTKIWLPDNLLMKTDKMTMAASLEARVPLLDYQLIEYAATIPSRLKAPPFRPKALFKRSFADMLPAAILQRKKMGFNVPTSSWLRQAHGGPVAALLLSERARSRGILNEDCVARLVAAHVAGQTDYGDQLFHLASLELWFRVFVDRSALEPPAQSLEELLECDGELVGADRAARGETA